MQAVPHETTQGLRETHPSGQGATMNKLFILSASVSKSEPGRTIHSLMQGYRACEGEDEAKGSFVSAVIREKPGFSILQLLCMAVPDDALSALTSNTDFSHEQ